MCYEEGVIPQDIDPGEMTVQGREARFKVSVVIDQAKVEWLKQHTVTIIFREGARFLSKKGKDDIVRAYEDSKVQDGSFERDGFRRGRVKIESLNVVSYVAKSDIIASWLILKERDELILGSTTYKLEFKPWLTKAQLKEQRREEDQRTFWVIAVQVPLDAMLFVDTQIQKVIGPIVRRHPTEPDTSLVNIKFDDDPAARANMKDVIWLETFEGDQLEVKLASSDTPRAAHWPPFCLQLEGLLNNIRANPDIRVPTVVTSGSAISSASAAAMGSDSAAIVGPSYGSPYMDRKVVMIPSKYDDKEDVESWMRSMRAYFEVQGTQRVSQSLILGTNVEPVVRGFLEVQAMQAGYATINLSEWLKVTPTTILEDILVAQYKDPHAAARVRIQLDELKCSKWLDTMHKLQLYVSKLFATPGLKLTAQSCLDVVKDAVAAAEAQQAAAEAERQRLANEVTAEAQRTAETNEAARNRRNAANMESLIASEHQWTTLLQYMIFVPTGTQAEPTQAEAEKSNLATVMLNVMRGVMWNNKLLQAHLHADRQQRQQYQQDRAAVTADVRDAATQQQQQQQLMNCTIARINGIEAKASAAPGCTTDATKQINERIDHVVTIIGDIGVFNGPETISSTVAAIKTDITKLQTRPDAATKTFKMPHFDICKFDDYNKSDTLTWWQRFLTEASCRTIPANDMLKALYLQLIGGAQAWMNHLAATHKCTIAELHTHITWKEFEQLWFTRFIVRNVVKAAMNEVYTCSQGNMPTEDWTTKWQKIVTTPGFDLSFPNQRSEFFSRSCAGLRSTLGNEYDYTTFQAILDRANLVIQTDDKAANERQSQPHYVAKQAYQRPTHNNAVISEEIDDHHAAAASSSDGGIVAALPPKRPKRVRKNKATQETAATGAGQPWTAYKITKEVYDLRQKYGYCLWCNGVTNVTAQCPEKGKARVPLCHRNKGRSRVPFGELKPLPIPRAPRLSTAMDVTGPFPRDRHDHDGILTVVDRLSKYARFLPCKYDAATPELARLLHTGWITNQGVPEDIVRDRDTRFMSAFWTSLMAESGTTMKPSSARHPQTDGQTERAHQTAERMLRTLIRPDQKDWVDRLPDIEFAYNTSVHPAICVTPFELHHGGEKARIFADVLLPQAADIDVPCSPASIRKYRDLLIKARANMQKAQIRMQQQANRRRLPCPFREGDLVWVLSEEFGLEQDVSRKLLPKWFGPWEVTSAVGDDPAGPSFVINIPPHPTVHRVFHASKLAIYTPPSADEFPGRRS
ncbi:hypothetical protein CBR_g12028 [Chara braunii]|uniref:Integrase catalytic domain-containing protein n=1 Tax=Chara braunii TaxID=69332 RepID=A0A388KQW7_CHABU|nr:hypothetical protein CBR_g12028 [Chara braunii]|eukprot:GBG72454.1 hypothetical protein CBR_g12028 [Chara braunii]